MISQVPTGFYVYTLADPRDQAVFYVGKGSANRAWQHEEDARRGSVINRAKTERLLAIIGAGLSASVTIIEAYDDEADAYEHEIELIASLPGLTNILAGGNGPTFNFTPEQIAARVAARVARIEARRKAASDKRFRDRATRGRRMNQAVADEYAPRVAGTRHEAAVADWLKAVNTREVVVKTGRGRRKISYQFP